MLYFGSLYHILPTNTPYRRIIHKNMDDFFLGGNFRSEHFYSLDSY